MGIIIGIGVEQILKLAPPQWRRARGASTSRALCHTHKHGSRIDRAALTWRTPAVHHAADGIARNGPEGARALHNARGVIGIGVETGCRQRANNDNARTKSRATAVPSLSAQAPTPIVRSTAFGESLATTPMHMTTYGTRHRPSTSAALTRVARCQKCDSRCRSKHVWDANRGTRVEPSEQVAMLKRLNRGGGWMETSFRLGGWGAVLLGNPHHNSIGQDSKEAEPSLSRGAILRAAATVHLSRFPAQRPETSQTHLACHTSRANSQPKKLRHSHAGDPTCVRRDVPTRPARATLPRQLGLVTRRPASVEAAAGSPESFGTWSENMLKTWVDDFEQRNAGATRATALGIEKGQKGKPLRQGAGERARRARFPQHRQRHNDGKSWLRRPRDSDKFGAGVKRRGLGFWRTGPLGLGSRVLAVTRAGRPHRMARGCAWARASSAARAASRTAARTTTTTPTRTRAPALWSTRAARRATSATAWTPRERRGRRRGPLVRHRQ